MCNFKRAKCTGARFKGADLTYSDFTHADLTGADFDSATLFRAQLHESIQKDATWSRSKSAALANDPELLEAERFRS
jgi:uncharacterized protein YjbI with pentapeptide repeats